MTVGGPGDVPWDESENARRYAAFARQYPIYRQTSEDLVALARPSGGATVVDLACGTGITTEAILAALGPDGRVIGVDGSAGMLAMAASSIPDSRYEESPDALCAWLSVPIFTERPLRGLSYGDRMAILDKACQHLGPGEPSVSRWIAFAARASGTPAS
jgi:SAM-dependent methyltransferase